jgi:hypothetical protein
VIGIHVHLRDLVSLGAVADRQRVATSSQVGMSNHTRPSDLVSSTAAASTGCSETPVALIHFSCTCVPPCR